MRTSIPPVIENTQGNWSKIPHALILHASLSDYAFRLAAILAIYDGMGRGCFPSEETLVSHVGSRTKLYRALAELRDRGLVSVKKAGRKNHYDLHFSFAPVSLKSKPRDEPSHAKSAQLRSSIDSNAIADVSDVELSAANVVEVSVPNSGPIGAQRVPNSEPISGISRTNAASTKDGYVLNTAPLVEEDVSNPKRVGVPKTRPVASTNMSRIRDPKIDQVIIRNTDIKKRDVDGIDGRAIRLHAIETQMEQCGISNSDAGAIAKALANRPIPIGIIVEATWEVMQRPARLRDRVSNQVGYIITAVERRYEKTPMAQYHDKFEALDPSGKIFLSSLDESKRSRLFSYMQKAGIQALPGPRLRDVSNYLDLTEPSSSGYALTS